ncbi:MAG: hypothetical protein HY704_07660 [Gemmatimonadetes bacterium]|nr:hypothetical protein [Gemmatimonadota bacterium]
MWPWRRWSRTRPSAALAFGVAVMLVAGCDGGPAGPDDRALEEQPGEPSTPERLSQGAEAAAGTLVGEDVKLTLEYLLGQAIEKVAREQGREAAKALMQTIEKLKAEAQTARKSGDPDAFKKAVAALRAEQVRIVLRVLGTGTAQQVVDGVAKALREVTAQVAAAKAAGKDVTKLEAALAEVAAVLTRARTALGAGDHAQALDLGTLAGEHVGSLRFAASVLDGSYVLIPTLEKLFAEALHKTAREKGRDAAKALDAALEPLRAALRAAKESKDREAIQKATAALRAEQIRIVVAVLGADAPKHVLDAVAKVLAEVKSKIAAAKATGKDVSHLEVKAQQAADLHARATAALSAGDLARALDLGTQAGEIVEALRRPLKHV